MNKLKPKINNNPMKNINKIELMLGSVFNIMALMRTIIGIIFLVLMMSCVLVVAPQDSYDKHLIHFHEDGIELPNCEWCNAYSDNEEEDDAE